MSADAVLASVTVVLLAPVGKSAELVIKAKLDDLGAAASPPLVVIAPTLSAAACPSLVPGNISGVGVGVFIFDSGSNNLLRFAH
jgi:hypothetical protein